MRNLLILLLFLHKVVIASPQSLPQDYSYSKRCDVLVDAGLSWSDNSTFHPLSHSAEIRKSVSATKWIQDYTADYAGLAKQLQDSSKNGLSLLFVPGAGASGQNGAETDYDAFAAHISLWAVAQYHTNWYAKLYVRATNEAESLPHYTGISRDIARAGLSTGEIDQSLLGYRSEWATIEYGRSREIWGTLSQKNLLLSENAPAWERILLQLKYKQLTYRWFYGFLESKYVLGENINRYLIGRALEYRNGHNLVISIGDVSTVAGPYRGLDWAFLNPLSVHLEIEQNNRENIEQGNRSNDIFFVNVDYLPFRFLRLSGSFVMDELQIDAQDRREGDADALAFFGRIAWTPMLDPIGITFLLYGNRIGTYAEQHSYGYNNMVSRGELIGHPIGNDADEYVAGVKFILPQNVSLELKIGRYRWGDQSMVLNPYLDSGDHSQTSFPSGNVRTNRFLRFHIDSNPYGDLNLTIDGHIDLNHSGEDSAREKYTLSLGYHLPMMWFIKD